MKTGPERHPPLCRRSKKPKEITPTIRKNNKADYVIALKKNQPNLHNELLHLFNGAAQSNSFFTDHDINGKIEQQSYYFISSLPCIAKQIAHAARTHWSIENSLHWRPDVVFREDESRTRKDNAPENLAVIRRIAVGLMKDRLPPKMTGKRARLRMALNWDFALKHFFYQQLKCGALGYGQDLLDFLLPFAYS